MSVPLVIVSIRKFASSWKVSELCSFGFSVCSTTLWVGHLSKLVGDDDLSDMFGEFGTVESIKLISPRGCAFICMNRRQDAARCLRELNKNKMHGKPITVSPSPDLCLA